MVAAIILLALAMFVAGGASIYNALNLVPTDFGFAYAQIGAILIASGGMTLATGLAVRAITARLDRFATLLAQIPQARAAGADLASREPAMESAMESDLAPDLTPVRPPNAELARSIGPAAGAADSRIASVPREGFDRPDPPAIGQGGEAAPQNPMASLGPAVEPATGQPAERIAAEHDLFVEFDRRAPITAPDTTDAEIPPERAPDDAIARAGPMEREDGPDRSGMIEAPVSRDPREPEQAATPPEENSRDEALAATDAPARPGPGFDDDGGGTPADIEMQSGDAPAPAGLIPDADLDWLATTAEPRLAPIETLEIVGSYDSAGTRFTMYSDGSVTASGERGERRFRSLEELRQHLDRNLASNG